MIAFVIVCAAMVAAAVLWIVWPLLRRAGDASASPAERHSSTLVIALLLPLTAIALYSQLSEWDFEAAEQAARDGSSAQTLLNQLEQKLKDNPDDVRGWMLLGRSYTSLGRYPLAVNAYQRAYELTSGEDVEAMIGLAEALTLTDQTTLAGRAGELFEAALQRAPNHPKALWYGGIAALQAGNLPVARERLALLVEQNPPPELKSLLERQIEDLDEQLGATGAAPSAPGSQAGRQIPVNVTLAASLQSQVTGEVPLFVLARDPAGGPPLAVQRRSSSELPLSITLSEADAMMPQRTIASATRVQVIARLSRSGNPQASSGDLYGQADYEFGKDRGTLNIMIDKIVP